MSAERVVIIDGCFLQCHGRVLANLVGGSRLKRFDALRYYRKHTSVFKMQDVPEEERRACARKVADEVGAALTAKSSDSSRVAQP